LHARDPAPASPNARDPLVERLLGPGKPFELEVVELGGFRREVFKGAPRTLAEIYRAAARFGPRPMVVQGEVCLTYDEVFAKAAALSRRLREEFGVVRGTKVALAMANRWEWVISLIAVTAAGGVAALINSRGVGEEMLRAMKTAGCSLAILDADRAALIAAEAPTPPWRRILIEADPAAMRPGDADFATLATPRPGETLEPVSVAPEDGALVLFTSGTTGFPKGALISHGALAHIAALSGFMGALLDLRYEQQNGETLPPERRSATSPTVIFSPMFHLSGMVPTVRATSVGATIHIVNKWNVGIAFETIEQVGLTRLGFVPTMLWDMLRSPKAGPSNLGAVLYVANGGAALNPALLDEMREKMPRAVISNTYGQTENGSWACSISGQYYLQHPESCGWAVPTVQAQTRRDDGSECAVGEPGELWVSSAGIMSEYYNDAKATAETLKDGWCASGDIGFVDENGLFTIVDRKKNMVISGGENIYCAEVERVLLDHPAIAETIAYGVPDERLGEKLVARVVVRTGHELTEDEVKAFSRKHLAIYKTPREVVLTRDLLPRTASGKVDRGVFLRWLKETG
jgi:acyl-CoA synthetase (AMP-forming)/AMP-acid ligase II